MPLKLNSAGGGSVTLDVPSTGSDFTATVPANSGTLVTTGSTAAVTQGMLASGVAGNGPAFFARSATDQTLSNNTSTKLTLGTEEFDTASCFSSSRFTPNVPGYYSLFGVAAGASTIAAQTALVEVRVFKNGSATSTRGSLVYLPASVFADGMNSNIADLVYLNGTTDYVELYGRVVANSGTPFVYGNTCVFSGFLARAA